MRLDPDAARRAVAAVAERIGKPVDATAQALVQIADNLMVGAEAGGGEVAPQRSVKARYLGQNHELELPVTVDRFDAAAAAALLESFDRLHAAPFGFANPGETIEFVNLAVTATVAQSKPELRRIEPASAPLVPIATRRVMFADGWHGVPVIRREDLRAGHRVDGPAVVEEAASVTPLEPALVLEVDRLGRLVIRRATA